MTDTTITKYTIEQILSCKEPNAVMPEELQQYCTNMKKYKMELLDELSPIMEQIMKSYNNGIDPNDVLIRNSIRENLNKLNSKNYDKILQEIKTLNYTNDTHFTFLASELIMKSMNDVMANKVNDAANKLNKSPTELYMDIAYVFSGYCTYTKNNEEVKFKIKMSKLCQQYFNKFVNKAERMDKNNPHRVIIYKGFMNMLGMLYVKNIFPIDIIFVCFTKILNLILDSSIPLEDRDNYYAGYERLMNRILGCFETTTRSPQLIVEFNNIKTQLHDINNKITQAYDSGLKPIERFSMIDHRDNIERYNKLCELYE